MRSEIAVVVVFLGCGGPGEKGPRGTSGEPCSVTDTADGAVIECPDGTSVTVTDGQDGADGNDNKIVSSHFCTGALENTALYFAYQATVLSSGDVFAYGGVYGSAFQIGASSYYSGEQNGAATATVVFAYDAMAPSNGGYWALSLNRATSVAVIVYNDVDATGGQDIWTMQPEDCVVSDF
jgi:hypothetical protein